MVIKVRFFAMLKTKAGKEEATLTVPEHIPFAQLKDILKKEFPALAEFIDRKSIMISVNQEFADKNTIIKDGDEVALLPPFSGG